MQAPPSTWPARSTRSRMASSSPSAHSMSALAWMRCTGSAPLHTRQPNTRTPIEQLVSSRRRPPAPPTAPRSAAAPRTAPPASPAGPSSARTRMPAFPPSVPPDDTDHDALDPNLFGIEIERGHVRIGRLEPHPAARLAVEPLHRRRVPVHQRHHHRPVFRVLPRVHHHVVAVPDLLVDHRVALHAQHVV